MADWDVRPFEKMMFIDTSKCIGCRACQVACKQWHSLPAETTSFVGQYTNPPDYSGSTLTYVKFTEFERRGKLKWLMLKNQCRHCLRPKCQPLCPKGVERTREGFVIFNDDCKPINVRVLGDDAAKIAAFIASCKFNVPRFNGTKFVKCDFCFDRFESGKYTTYRDGNPTTACELACPSNAIVTGTFSDMRSDILDRFGKVRLEYPYASLYKGGFGRTHVIYLLVEKPSSYGL